MSIVNEAFKQLKKLNEETFDIDDFEGIEDFTKKDLKDPLSVAVIDPDAESEEELEDSYIGKVILDCCICHSKLYKDPLEVEISEDDELVNTDEECPYCYSMAGFKVVGQVAPYSKEEVKIEVEPKEVKDEVEVETNESLTEARRKSFKSLDSIDAEMDDRKEKARKRFLRAKDDARSDRDYKVKRDLRKEAVTEDRHATYGGRNSGPNVREVKKPDPDLSKKEGTMTSVLEKNMEKVWGAKSKNELKDTIKKLFDAARIDTDASRRLLANIDRQKDLVSAQSTVANSILAGSGLKTVKENFDKVEIETETDRIKVESEPKENMADEETIAPISAEIESEFKSQPEEMPEVPEDEIEFDVDEIQEESFNTLAEGYLKKVYENVDSYKTTKVSNNGNKLIFEGIIKFTSGNSKKTSFVFESSTATRSGKVKFIGENKQITRGKKAFMLEGKLNKNSLLTESLRYNYKAKDSTGKSSRIYGRILSK